MSDLFAAVAVAIGDFGTSGESVDTLKLIMDDSFECPESLIR